MNIRGAILCAWALAICGFAALPLRAQEVLPPPETVTVPTAPGSPYLFDFPSTQPWHGPLPQQDYGDGWTPQVLPNGIVYRSYLAGPKESRISSFWFNEQDQGSLWDITLGGRAGIYRYGTKDEFRPEGFQVDIEGAAELRLDPEEERDLTSSDFRFGVPLTYAVGVFETKLAYYHLSSHLGDEFLLKNPGVERINYSRDAVVLGLAMYPTEDVRIYAEAGYAFVRYGGAEPWEFQVGAEFSPACTPHLQGAPFAAVNLLMRDEVDFGGTFTAQAGWQWRGYKRSHLARAGVQYQAGKSPQLEFLNRNEEQLGVALWYDY